MHAPGNDAAISIVSIFPGNDLEPLLQVEAAYIHGSTMRADVQDQMKLDLFRGLMLEKLGNGSGAFLLAVMQHAIPGQKGRTKGIAAAGAGQDMTCTAAAAR